jgi:hypothetical protein
MHYADGYLKLTDRNSYYLTSVDAGAEASVKPGRYGKHLTPQHLSFSMFSGGKGRHEMTIRRFLHIYTLVVLFV